MREKQEAGRGTAIARRLRAVLEAEHIPTQGAFAVRLGIEQQRLNNAFRGYPLSIDLAQRIKRAVPGMTLDWLYDGDEAWAAFKADVGGGVRRH